MATLSGMGLWPIKNYNLHIFHFFHMHVLFETLMDDLSFMHWIWKWNLCVKFTYGKHTKFLFGKGGGKKNRRARKDLYQVFIYFSRPQDYSCWWESNYQSIWGLLFRIKRVWHIFFGFGRDSDMGPIHGYMFRMFGSRTGSSFVPTLVSDPGWIVVFPFSTTNALYILFWISGSLF